jgi:GNAT superfamily N-acetyltransferase
MTAVETGAGVVAQARRIEAAEADAVAACARTFAARGRLARVREVAGGWAAFAGAGFPVNRAVGLGMSRPVTAEDLDEVEHFYEELGAVGQVDVCPYADPSLVGLLRSRGYTLLRFFSVLTRPLVVEDAAAPGAAAAPCAVELVGPEHAELWAQTAARAFTNRQTVPADHIDLLLARAATTRPGVRCFLARSGDEPAGVGAVNVHERVATLFSAATMPAFRRRGVQAALVAARLGEAARAGCDLAAVLAEPASDSERNLERSGFRGLYTRAIAVRPGSRG